MIGDSALAVEADGLVRRFGEVRAVDGVDLAIPAGSIHALLGPNGAGKSTTVRLLATLLSPDGGSARIHGHDIVTESEAVRARISLTGQFASLDEDLTGWENLILISRLLGQTRSQARKRAADLLERFGLSGAAERQVRKYSGGMRRRLDIAASIVVTPELLFLDEPTTGLDPSSRQQVWEMIRTIANEGATVLLTTQNLDEADRLADGITVIDHGRIVAEGTSSELKSLVGGGMFQVRLRHSRHRGVAGEILSSALGVPIRTTSDPLALAASVSGSVEVTHALADLSRSGVELADFALARPSLDEVFLALTGQPTESSVGPVGEKA